MNDKQNEKQLMPLKRILLYVLIIGGVLMLLAYVAGFLTFGDNVSDEPFTDEATATQPIE